MNPALSPRPVDPQPVETLVVIVNYRTAALTLACLESLAPEMVANPRARAVVVDNASGDGSDVAIAAGIERMGIGGWCDFRALPRNGGFAYGNNGAIAAWREDHGSDGRPAPLPPLVWLLNPDTLVRPDALGALIRFMHANPAVGIAGGRSEEEDGTPLRSAFRFHTPLNEAMEAIRFGPVDRLLAGHVVAPPPPTAPERVDWVAGASMMIRGDLLERLGFLDEEYFMYFEETDFCLRAARAGASCWYVPESRIVHLVGQASGVTGSTAKAKRRPRYWFESRRRYFVKNLGPARFHLANLGWLIAYPIGRVIAAVRGRRNDDPPHLWWDMLRHYYLVR